MFEAVLHPKISYFSSGSLISGVIGARKPVYDIWGRIFFLMKNILILLYQDMRFNLF